MKEREGERERGGERELVGCFATIRCISIFTDSHTCDVKDHGFTNGDALFL